jgi:hypothetical protein
MAIFSFILNNPFTGNYDITGYFFHPTSPRALNISDFYLATTGPVSNKFPFGDLGTAANNYYFIANSPEASGAPTSGSLTNYVAAGGTPASPASGFMTLDNPGNINYSTSAFTPGGSTYNIKAYPNTLDASGGVGSLQYWLHVGYYTGTSSQLGWSRQLYMNMVEQ